MSIARRFGDLRTSLRAQATPRALVGLAVLVVIVAVIALSDLSALVTGLRADVDDLQRERRLEMALLSDQSWIERADEVDAELAAARASFWRGATPGIIAAQLQGVIETAARQAALDQPRVTVQTEPSALGVNAVLFEIELTARDRDGQFLALFQELSRAERALTISGFEWNRANGRLMLRIEAPGLLEVGEPENGR